MSQVFANEAFGYRKITVERPLCFNFAAPGERIARIEAPRTFQNLVKRKKRAGPACEAFVAVLRGTKGMVGMKSLMLECKTVLSSLGEREPEAKVCYDRRGKPGAGYRTARHRNHASQRR